MDGKDCSFLKDNNIEAINSIEVCHNMQKLIVDNIDGQEIAYFKIKFIAEAKTYQFTECVFKDGGIKFTSNNSLVDAYNVYKYIFSEYDDISKFMYDEKFKIYTPLMKIAEYNKLINNYSTF